MKINFKNADFETKTYFNVLLIFTDFARRRCPFCESPEIDMDEPLGLSVANESKIEHKSVQITSSLILSHKQHPGGSAPPLHNSAYRIYLCKQISIKRKKLCGNVNKLLKE